MSMRLTIVAAVFGLLAIPTLASAHAGNDDPNVVHACIGNVSKDVRIVGVSGSCISSPAAKAETPAHWAIQGPQGPQGLQGEQGPQGIQGLQGAPGAAATNPDPPCFDNANRYVNCGNGTVTDTVTGLIWLQDAACLGVTDWAAGNQAAAALANGQCGLTDGSSAGDWRLPTKDEWSATIARAKALGCTSPSLTSDAGTVCLLVGPSSFAGVESFPYWSSTSDETLPSSALVTELSYGGTDVVNKNAEDYTLRVWPVRGGPR